MENKNLIEKTILFVKNTLENAEGGHDWWHIYRVWQVARHIAGREKVDMLVVELAALLHDIADAKFHGGDEEVGPTKAARFLESLDVAPEIVAHVKAIVANISFRGGRDVKTFSSPELKVVQDADRLDAIGAIGIARAFNYGGFKGRGLYDPAIPPNLNMTKEEYKNSSAPTINHFYEKLLLLKDKMNTEAGKEMAARRHHFMLSFLAEFYREWDGEG